MYFLIFVFYKQKFQYSGLLQQNTWNTTSSIYKGKALHCKLKVMVKWPNY
jgi:hypothetical protein